MRQPQLVDDEQLGRLVTARNSRAFSILYERYYGILYRYCRSILHSEADAHDAVQSTFTRALEALQRDQRDAPIRPWLFRIARNEAISLLRRRRVSDQLAAHAGAQGISVEDRAHAREELRSLVADLRELPEGPRGAIVLREMSGLSHDEIATTLGTNATAVKHAIHEARKALTEAARGRQMECREVRRAIAEGDRRVLRSRRIRAHLGDCAECARFVASRPHHAQRLRALPPLGRMTALGHVVARTVHSAPLNASVQDATVSTSVLGAAAGKITAVLGSKVVIAGVIAAGAATAGLTYGFNQAAGPAPRAADLGSILPQPSDVARRAQIVAKPRTSSFRPVGQRQTLLSIPEWRRLAQPTDHRPVWRPGNTGKAPATSATGGSNSSSVHSAGDHQASQALRVGASARRSPSSPAADAYGSAPGRRNPGAAAASRDSGRGRASGRNRGNGSQPAHGRSQPAHHRGQPAHVLGQRAQGPGQPAQGPGQPAHGPGQPAHASGGAPGNQRRASAPVDHASPGTAAAALPSKPPAQVGQVPIGGRLPTVTGAVTRRISGPRGK